MRIPCWLWLLVLVVVSCLLSWFAGALALGPVFSRLAAGTIRETNVTWQASRGIWLCLLAASALTAAVVAIALAVRFMRRGLITRLAGCITVIVGILAGLSAIGCMVVSLLFGMLRV